MSKFYTLGNHSIRKSHVLAVSVVRFQRTSLTEDQHGFYVYFGQDDGWWTGYDGEDMAVAQRAKFMEALEEGDD